jgi:hypothetical protein
MHNHRLAHLLALLFTAGLWVAQSPALPAQQTAESPVEKHIADAGFVHIPNAPDCFLAVIEHGHAPPGSRPRANWLRVVL